MTNRSTKAMSMKTMKKLSKRGPGRPVVPTPCRWCHASHPAGEVRAHESICRKSPKNGKPKRERGPKEKTC